MLINPGQEKIIYRSLKCIYDPRPRLCPVYCPQFVFTSPGQDFTTATASSTINITVTSTTTTSTTITTTPTATTSANTTTTATKLMIILTTKNALATAKSALNGP